MVRPHDLLQIDAEVLIGALHQSSPAPGWVPEHLRISQCVVVRRGPGTDHDIPIGIRGGERNQRWAGFCQAAWIRGILTPPQLLSREISRARLQNAPAFRALQMLQKRWRDPRVIWGPGGSVGFELATGIPVVKAESDLDIVIYADETLAPEEAQILCDCATGLPAAVDIRVETPTCGFSLREYAKLSPAPILLRTPSGPALGTDPWARDPR